MTQHFNGLTPAEAERLAMLAEEAGEIVQAVTKILRHGYESYHPDDPNRVKNRTLLMEEIVDFHGVWSMMLRGGEVGPVPAGSVREAELRKLRYSHHQEDHPDRRRGAGA